MVYGYLWYSDIYKVLTNKRYLQTIKIRQCSLHTLHSLKFFRSTPFVLSHLLLISFLAARHTKDSVISREANSGTSIYVFFCDISVTLGWFGKDEQSPSAIIYKHCGDCEFNNCIIIDETASNYTYVHLEFRICSVGVRMYHLIARVCETSQ